MVQKVSDCCCGCGACENACPVGAIRYVADCNGFYKPIVDEEKCIKCCLCLQKCPVEKPEEKLVGETSPLAVYACRNKDAQILHKSSSGGVFAALARKVLEEDGYVFGCGWDGLKAKHVEVCDSADLPKLYKSKYVQSDMRGVHEQIVRRLKEGKTVLFCGTPCQVTGLKSGLGAKYANLITVDFICHGVPSTKVFEQYIHELERMHESSVIDVRFRDKDYGWNELHMTISFANGDKYSKPAEQDGYYKAFLCNLSLNKCCGECRFNCLPRASDITLGDFWRIETYKQQFVDNKGVSCVVLNSEKGLALFAAVQSQLITAPSSVTEVMEGNPFLNGHCKPHKRRDVFFNNLDKEPFDTLVSSCLKPTPLEWVIEVVKYKLGIK